MFSHSAVLVLAVVATACQGIEVIESVFKGEKYEGEASRLENLPYSSSHIATAFGSDGGDLQARKVPDEEGRNFPYSGLMQQLGEALNNLVSAHLGQGGRQDEGRDLDLQEEGKQEGKEDLHYHFYPHNQHLFNLPECATQQVCNAVYKRLNFTQPLCACPSGSDPCSASFRADDRRSIELRMGGPQSQAVTLIKTCEPIWSVRECKSPRDWSILALQNTRTGKAHYLVICKCPDSARLDGPLNHDQPAYAQVPGIRVYGMMCIRSSFRRAGRVARDSRLAFPWGRVSEALKDEKILQDLLADAPYAHAPIF